MVADSPAVSTKRPPQTRQRVRVHRTLPAFHEGKNVVLSLTYDRDQVSRGKFVVGRAAQSGDQIVVIYDQDAYFHKDMVDAHRLEPFGGGWLTIDTEGKSIQVSGESQAYGREADRGLTVEALRSVYPDYLCEAE